MADGSGEGHILICGGCGFIGSNFIKTLIEFSPDTRITVADALTYAGSTENIEPYLSEQRVAFVQADISDPQQLSKLQQSVFSLVVNFAAETHVDRSLYHADRFVRANVLGTQNLLAFCRGNETDLLHISTDEVYGPTPDGESFTESAPLNPTSPYAASKAAADLLVLAAVKTHKQRAVIVRTCNNCGPRQFPEKLIPYFFRLMADGKSLPLYGDGLQKRSWLFVEDFCKALLPIMSDFPAGEALNIGTELEFTNLELVKLLLKITKADSKIEHVADRPAHDRRYALDFSRYEKRYGKIPARSFDNALQETTDWYRQNPKFFERMLDPDSVAFRQRHYSSR